MKKLILVAFLFTIFVGVVYCQASKYALHVTNPIGFIQKAGVKFEYRTPQTGWLLALTQYYGTIPDYPGTQLGIEWRHYALSESKRGENFLYAKLIAGHQQFRAQYGDGFFNHFEVPESYYGGLGAGVGRKISFNHFFIDLNIGLKASLSTITQDNIFYIVGPASFLDLHANIGYQF